MESNPHGAGATRSVGDASREKVSHPPCARTMTPALAWQPRCARRWPHQIRQCSPLHCASRGSAATQAWAASFHPSETAVCHRYPLVPAALPALSLRGTQPRRCSRTARQEGGASDGSRERDHTPPRLKTASARRSCFETEEHPTRPAPAPEGQRLRQRQATSARAHQTGRPRRHAPSARSAC